MKFGDAVEALKAGKRVARAGWNGKGMWLVLLVPGVSLPPLYKGLPTQPCIAMRTAQIALQPGWLASQADILSEDWEIIDAAADPTGG